MCGNSKHARGPIASPPTESARLKTILPNMHTLKATAVAAVCALLAVLPMASRAQDAASGYRFSPVNQYGMRTGPIRVLRLPR